MIRVLLILLVMAGTLWAASDEEMALKDLISHTKIKLAQEEKVLELLTVYLDKKEEFVDDMSSALRAKNLLIAAVHLQNGLMVSHLGSYFSSSLLEEIAFFSQYGNEKNVTLQREEIGKS